MRDVEHASIAISERFGNEEFIVTPSRLADIETKGVTPSIYRLYALAVIYGQDIQQILALYSVNV
jgi:transcriptional regulator with XRE-family HTH domain